MSGRTVIDELRDDFGRHATDTVERMSEILLNSDVDLGCDAAVIRFLCWSGVNGIDIHQYMDKARDLARAKMQRVAA